GTGVAGCLEAVSRAGGAGPPAGLGHLAGPGRRATERAGCFEAVSRAERAGARAGRGRIAGPRRRATERAGVAGRMLAGRRGAITLIQRADIAIIRTGRPGRLEAVGRADGAGAC